MSWKSNRRSHLIVWQLLFLLLGTSWLWAPQINHSLSGRTSLISQYESPHQPYAWLFRLCDGAAAGLLIMASLSIRRHKKTTQAVWALLLIVGLGMLTDVAFATSCRIDQLNCREHISPVFVVHALETTITAGALFGAALYDSAARKRLVSIGFLVFQVLYGLLLLSQLATNHHFNSLSQYIYQTGAIVWLAWFVYTHLADKYKGPVDVGRASLIRQSAAVWAFLNGVVAIVASLTHLHLYGHIRELYFAGDSAWLTQHGVTVGAVMIYLSRHLARGERRARQIFLLICGLEVIKYSVITPHPLLFLFVITFGLLFVLRDEFYRGTVILTWEKRLKEAAFIGASIALAVAIGFIIIGRDNDSSQVVTQAVDNFFDYSLKSAAVPRSHIPSALFAHTLSALIVVAVVLILWVLFRPYKKITAGTPDYHAAEVLLNQYSSSTEDFFKLWPPDKQFFWARDKQGFIAYKISGGTAFALADPISKKTGQSELVKQFLEWCQQRRLTACFLPVYPDSQKLYAKAGLSEIQVGSSAVVDVDEFLNKTVKDKWWRWQTNRAAKNGYSYKLSQPPHNPQLLAELEKLSKLWLTKNNRKERSFALGYFDKQYLQKCSIHYLKNQIGQVVAFTNQIPNFKRSDMATIDLLRYLPDADHPMPYLLHRTIESLASQYKYFDLGFVPFASISDPVVAIAKSLSVGRFSARGLEQFKNKFDPQWQPNYMAYEGNLADLALVAVNLERVMDLEL